MTEFNVSLHLMAAGAGPLIAIYVILAFVLALGVFALYRLFVLARMTRKLHPKAGEAPDCESCEKLAEKEKEIVTLQDENKEKEQQVVTLKEDAEAKDKEIVILQERIKELEAAAAAAPVPAAVVVEERTLSESLAAASLAGSKGVISKKSIIAYLSKKYGDKVELNGRGNRTPNGKLLLSDNHFGFAPDGKRVCFTYVYETDDGQVVSLIKLDEPYVQAMLAAHPEVKRSAFPKNKAKDWYSVVADATFTEAGYYAVLDHAIALITGDKEEPVKEEPVAEVSLKESLAAAKEAGVTDVVSKKSIIEHLAATFGDKVELNGRENRTPNGKLLLSDNHFTFAPDGKRVCFTYVYEDEGNVTILLRTTEAHAKDIHAAHAATGVKSAFPKNKEHDWYSMVVDGSFTAAGVYAELDRAAANIIGIEMPVAEKPVEEVSLKESLAAAKEAGVTGIVSKKSIIEHLAATFGDKVELNGRENRTPNGKLLLSDNHFAFAPDGKRVCFTYVYEDEGNVTILLRTTEAHAKDIHTAHPATGVKSAFPKNKEHDWYSIIVDGSFTAAGVYAELDRAAANIIGIELPATEQPAEDVSLKESLAAAKEAGVTDVVSKKSIIEHLAATFGDKVELNGRGNRTPNGKLLLSDNHFAFAPDGKRVCFTYIYEDEGSVTILLRTTEAHAKDIHAAHPATGVKSAFPKNKEHDWYSMVVDGSFTAEGVYAELDRAVVNIIGAENAPAILTEPVAEEAPAEQPQEVSLKESLAAAKEADAAGIVTKKDIRDHLALTFDDKVELNGRENRTPNGKLLLSDNHFAFAPDGKRVCFAYVYEDEGRVTILLRTTEEHARVIHVKHPHTGVKSAFPKNKEHDWYSVVVDKTFTKAGVFAELDRAALNIIEAKVEPKKETVAPETAEAASEEVSLKASLAAAKDTGAVGIVTKKSIIEYLSAKYGDKVELNGRVNRTPNGKLLLSDNHFALAEGKRVCFTYIYEDEGRIVILLRASAELSSSIHAAHPATGVKSAFPKNKDKDWYSVIVDESFTEENVREILDRSIEYVLSK